MQLGLFDIKKEEIDRFRDNFDAGEWDRIVDRLELVLRDRAIRNEFRTMRRQGVKYDAAIRSLSPQFHLSESQISHIVYPRKARQK